MIEGQRWSFGLKLALVFALLFLFVILKTPFNRKKPGAGPGSYRGTLLLMADRVKEEKGVIGQSGRDIKGRRTHTSYVQIMIILKTQN